MYFKSAGDRIKTILYAINNTMSQFAQRLTQTKCWAFIQIFSKTGSLDCFISDVYSQCIFYYVYMQIAFMVKIS